MKQTKLSVLNQLQELTGARDIRELCDYFGFKDASDFWKPVKETEAAEILGLAIPTLRNYRHMSKPPGYVKNGKAVSYLPATLYLHNLSNQIVLQGGM